MTFSLSQTNLKKISSLTDIKAGIQVDYFFNQSLLDPVDLRILLCHALKLSHAQLILHAKNKLNETQTEIVLDLLKRRLNGEPIAYIVGKREFYDLSLKVLPDVLIPRPETELLVDLAIDFLPENAHFLDLGTGSGAIAISVANKRKDISVTATDISNAALEIAKLNASYHIKKRERMAFYQGSWFSAIPDLIQFDLITSNPPYIEKNNIHLTQGDLRYEPIQALTDFSDGLSAYRDIIAQAPKWLKKGGRLIMEHGYNQKEPIKDLLQANGFVSIETWQDLAGIDRVTGGILI